MSKVKLSINPLAEFIYASEKRKASIVKSQKKPSPFIVAWYKSAKSVMSKFYRTPNDLGVIEDGLRQIKSRKPESDWQTSNRRGQIELLERFIRMKVPLIFSSEEIDFIKPEMKSMFHLGVDLITSPELLFRVKDGDVWYYGAVKFHTSKSSKFDRTKCKTVSTVLKMFLNRYVKEFDPTGKVNPSYCFCVDVFNELITTANEDSKVTEERINNACIELVKLWDAA